MVRFFQRGFIRIGVMLVILSLVFCTLGIGEERNEEEARMTIEPPSGAQIVREAEDFARSNLKVSGAGEWGDASPVLVNNEAYPNYAEYDLEITKEGFYDVFFKYAAGGSRPVNLFIDGQMICSTGLSNTTGDWHSSTAKWEWQTITALTTGKHILRLERKSFIPHIDALALRHDKEVTIDKSLEKLPAECFIRDNNIIQDWWICGIGGIQNYIVRDNAFCILNGGSTFNRPLYGTNNPTVLFTGDKPQFLFAQQSDKKLGILSLGVDTKKGGKWLHEFNQIEAIYGAGVQRYKIEDTETDDPEINGLKIYLEAVYLAEAEGFMVRIQPSRPTTIVWVYGGLKAGGGFNLDFSGFGGWEPGLHVEDGQKNQINIRDNVVSIVSPDLPDYTVRVGSTPESTVKVVNLLDNTFPGILSKKQDAEGRPFAVGVLPSDSSGYIWVVLEHPQFPTSNLEAKYYPGHESKIIKTISDSEINPMFQAAVEHYRKLAERLVVITPDSELNAAVRANNLTIDGIFRPPSFLHGAIHFAGWFLGWRGWYGPIMCGDYERVKAAIRFNLDGSKEGNVPSFTTEVGERKWQGYNMNEVFLDHVFTYWRWTGDLALMREIWPALKMCIEYEKKFTDPNDDGLHSNEVNTFISDGHHYAIMSESIHGDCIQATAYNYRINLLAAEVSEALGEDAMPYREQMKRIRKASRQLWLKDLGYFAEYRDSEGVIHPASESPSIYHPVEFGLADSLDAYQCTRYVVNRLWRFGDQILVNDWFPVIPTNGTLVYTETLNTAIAFFVAGDAEKANRLLRTCTLAFTRRAAVPGSISCYSGSKGEQGIYVDFADASSMYTRTVVEGLFGLHPNVPAGKIEIVPGFPSDWNNAQLKVRDIDLEFSRQNLTERYRLITGISLAVQFRLRARYDTVKSVKVNGVDATYELLPGVGVSFITVVTNAAKETIVEITYTSNSSHSIKYPQVVVPGETLSITTDSSGFSKIEDPQGIVAQSKVSSTRVEVVLLDKPGHHTFFADWSEGSTRITEPINVEVHPAFEITSLEWLIVSGFRDKAVLHATIRNSSYLRRGKKIKIEFLNQTNSQDIDLEPGKTIDIYVPLEEMSTKFLSPGTTKVSMSLEDNLGTFTVMHGMARLWRLFDGMSEEAPRRLVERCNLIEVPYNDRLEDIFTREYKDPNKPFLNWWTNYQTDNINLNHVRESLRDGVFTTDVGIPFRQSSHGKNGLFVNRWSSHPDKAQIDIGAQGCKLYLLMANTTQNSQTHLVQARLAVIYDIGDPQVIDLMGPHDIDSCLQHYSDNFAQWIGGTKGGYYGAGSASGVHADVLDINIDPSRTVSNLIIKAITKETLVGVLGVTLLKQ